MNNKQAEALVKLLIKYDVDYDTARLIVLGFEDYLREHKEDR